MPAGVRRLGDVRRARGGGRVGVAVDDADDLPALSFETHRPWSSLEDGPIAFRPQNGGDYTDAYELAIHVAEGQSGLLAHIKET